MGVTTNFPVNIEVELKRARIRQQNSQQRELSLREAREELSSTFKRHAEELLDNPTKDDLNRIARYLIDLSIFFQESLSEGCYRSR